MNDHVAVLHEILGNTPRDEIHVYQRRALAHALDAVAERDALVARLGELEKGLLAVESLINDSAGVGGLHLNGDFAEWESLRTGGQFEDWLADFDTALARVVKESST